jgi:hypothetical protein
MRLRFRSSALAPCPHCARPPVIEPTGRENRFVVRCSYGAGQPTPDCRAMRSAPTTRPNIYRAWHARIAVVDNATQGQRA